MADQKKILVVDDEADLVVFLKTLLEDNGYAVVTANDGNQAMEKVKSEKPDLITLDISMPEKSGVKFYREMKEDDSLKSTPVVVVTAVTGFGDKPEVFEKFLGSRKQVPPPEGFVSKPVDNEELIAKVKELTG